MIWLKAAPKWIKFTSASSVSFVVKTEQLWTLEFSFIPSLAIFNKKTLSLFYNWDTRYKGRFINPFTDFGFKFLFGREVEKELLIDFLNDLLVGEHVITDIQFLNNEQQPEVKQNEDLSMIYIVEPTRGSI